LVKICAASVNPLDSGVMRGTGRLMGTGLLKPREKALGSDFAGRVEAVGRHVKQYKPGDEVFGGIFGVGVGLPNTCVLWKTDLHESQPTYPLSRQQPYQWRQSLPFRAFVIKDGSREVKRF